MKLISQMPAEMIRERRKKLNEKNFPSEMWFKKILDHAGINGYLRNWPIDGRFFGDFVWRRKKIVVEIDGKSHEGTEEYDKMRDNHMKHLGYKVYRIKHGDSKRSKEVIEILINLFQNDKSSLLREKLQKEIDQKFFNKPKKNRLSKKQKKALKKSFYNKAKQDIDIAVYNSKLNEAKSVEARNEIHVNLLRNKIKTALNMARSMGKKRGNAYLENALNTLNVTPERAKILLNGY